MDSQEGRSTPCLVNPLAVEVLTTAVNSVYADLHLPEDNPLYQHLSRFTFHDFDERDVDHMSIKLALATQNRTLVQNLQNLTLQVQNLTAAVEAGRAETQALASSLANACVETNSTISHVRSCVSSLEQRVATALTPNPPNPAQSQNAKSAEPPVRRKVSERSEESFKSLVKRSIELKAKANLSSKLLDD